jgi:quinol monooxygenase YgiN
MIIRIVKMTFIPEKLSDFLELFNSSKYKIRNFDGCTHLELLNDIKNKNVFFTYSHWESEDHLNRYRNSALFETVWSATKKLFHEKPEAWTVVQKDNIE